MTEIAPWLTFAATIAGPAAVLWYQRREFNKQDASISAIKSRMDCFEQSQHACQLENARHFATKDELGRIASTVDGHSKDIAEIKGRLSR